MQTGKLLFAEELLKAGADPLIEDHDGNTVAMAVQKLQDPFMDALLKKSVLLSPQCAACCRCILVIKTPSGPLTWPRLRPAHCRYSRASHDGIDEDTRLKIDL